MSHFSELGANPLRPVGPLGTDAEVHNDARSEELVVRFLAPHAQQDTRPWWQDYARLDLEQSGLSRICLWGEEGALSVFRTRLRSVLKDPASRRTVVKCRRTQQPNGRTRYDLWVKDDLAPDSELIRALEKGRDRFGWYHRPHIPYVDRVGRGISPSERRRRETPTTPRDTAPLQGRTGMDSGRPLRIGTLNINGVNKKRTELRYLLRLEKIGILCMQETRQRAAHWPLRLSGYKSFVALGEEMSSVRGLAILVRNKYNCEPVGRASPFWLFVRVSGGDLTEPFIIGTVYVPPRHNRAQIFRLLPGALASIEAAHPGIPVVLTGDFNMELHTLQLEMTSWPTPFQAMDNKGSKATRNGARARQIDHFDPVSIRPLVLARKLRQIDHFAYRGFLGDRLPPIP